jgi:murein L,D-transpeptidase YcbB/YkuD
MEASRVGRNLICMLLLCGTLASAQNRKASAAAPGAKLADPQSMVRSLIQAGRLDDLRWPNFSDYRVHLQNFYRPADYDLAWIHNGMPTMRAQEFISVFSKADLEGLRPEDYDALRWPSRLALLQGAHSLTDEVRFDVALSVCTMRYISDVRIGRINPRHFKFGLDIEHKKLDLPAFVRQLLAPSTDVQAELSAIEPIFPGYKATRVALLRYAALAKEMDNPRLPPPPGMVFPGGPYEQVGRMAEFLRQVGDLPQDAVVHDEKIYEEPLVDAVKHFQERHGLRPDGYLTRSTIEAMDVPLSSRVEQLRLTLERYRWLRYDPNDPPVVVNLPGYRLYAFESGGKLGLTMNVNVGDAYDFQTPIFENKIRYLVFRPYWNIPPKILRNEVVADIENDRNYIKDSDMEVTSPDGKVVTAGVISDEVLQQLRAGKLAVRQRPGPENALGLVKIIFPNEHSVYLHDTPESVDMFSLEERALSHGCIHLQHPAELAAWLLRDQPAWTLERVEKAMHDGPNNITVNLTKPVPILIVYATAVVGRDGDVDFYKDIYGHDASLEASLAEGYPYP